MDKSLSEFWNDFKEKIQEVEQSKIKKEEREG